MSDSLKYIYLRDFELKSGKVQDVCISYQLYGRDLHTAPIILINHALTGNSNVLGWWHEIVGTGKVIDLNNYSVLALNIPGNGYDGNVDHLIFNYQDWRLSDVAGAFAKALQSLNISIIEYGIGGSIGGGLLWEMLALEPKLFKTIIPIAADWKATDWLVACCSVQKMILETSDRPLETARAHAITFYRSPLGMKLKFNRSRNYTDFKVTQWLEHHGKSLKKRFSLPAYKLMNHLLTTLDANIIIDGQLQYRLLQTQTKVELIAIDSDGFFTAKEDQETYKSLENILRISYHEINSPHGHDAFLIENEQVTGILKYIIQQT